MNRSQRLMTLCEMFTPEEADAAVERLQTGIQAPYVKVYKSSLGGVENTSILLTVSLDPRESWHYDILENSRYFRMHYLKDGSLECFSGGRIGFTTKFRKTKVKSPDEAVAKINKFISLQEQPK